MRGGRFLVGLREAASSEKIIKLKTLLKDDIVISNIMESNVEHDKNIETSSFCSFSLLRRNGYTF